MINLGPRYILDKYRGFNYWNPHYPLMGLFIMGSRKDFIVPVWSDNYVLNMVII